MAVREHHGWISELLKLYQLTGMALSSAEFKRAMKNIIIVHDDWRGHLAMPKNMTVYRVALHPDKPNIEVVSLGMERVDTVPDHVYDDFSQLPAWMQERLHVMAMLDDTAPTEHVTGFGRRISKYVFWLEIPKENYNG